MFFQKHIIKTLFLWAEKCNPDESYFFYIISDNIYVCFCVFSTVLKAGGWPDSNMVEGNHRDIQVIQGKKLPLLETIKLLKGKMDRDWEL